MDATGAETLVRAMTAATQIAQAPRFLLIGCLGMLGDTRQSVEAIGGQIVGECNWDEFNAGEAPLIGRSVLAFEAQGVDDEALTAAFPLIDAALDMDDAAVVFSFDPAALDLVATALMDKSVQLLCAPTPSDRALALALATQAVGEPILNDTAAYEGEAARLKRLNDEVARIADVLSRLTRRETAEHRPSLDVAERRQSFAEPLQDVAIEPAEIRQAIRARRMRDQHFGTGLFEEPGWDMILDLFAAELERTRVSVSSLCIAAAVAPTTALRWISKLTDAGLFERQPDPFDRRRAFMELSDRASRAMRDYIAALRRAGLSLA